jgi:hypothetical protein
VLPFGSQLGGELFGKGGHFMTKKSVGGTDEGGEMATLLEASLEVLLLLLLLFLGLNDLLWILVLIQLGVCVGDLDINYAVGASSPEASQEDVSSVIFSGWCISSAAGWARSHFLCSATFTD